MLTEIIAPGQTTLTSGFGSLTIPITIQLTSNNVTRKIELSLDGVNYFQPSYDVIATEFVIVSLSTPMNYIKITGIAGDKLILDGIEL